jgi:hypothetical protein
VLPPRPRYPSTGGSFSVRIQGSLQFGDSLFPTQFLDLNRSISKALENSPKGQVMRLPGSAAGGSLL